MEPERSRRLRADLAVLGGDDASGGRRLELADRRLSRRDGPHAWLASLVAEPYIVHGCLSALSFLLIGIAWWPDLRHAGWGGCLLGVLVLAGTVVSALSYLATPEDSPLHVL